MKIDELYLKTAFCCMACDGEIVNEEINLIKEVAKRFDLFSKFDVENEINNYIKQINENGKVFLDDFINELVNEELTIEEEKQIIKIAFQTIEADRNINYSEISFFKNIRFKLNISDDEILKEFPNKGLFVARYYCA